MRPTWLIGIHAQSIYYEQGSQPDIWIDSWQLKRCGYRDRFVDKSVVAQTGKSTDVSSQGDPEPLGRLDICPMAARTVRSCRPDCSQWPKSQVVQSLAYMKLNSCIWLIKRNGLGRKIWRRGPNMAYQRAKGECICLGRRKPEVWGRPNTSLQSWRNAIYCPFQPVWDDASQ